MRSWPLLLLVSLPLLAVAGCDDAPGRSTLLPSPWPSASLAPAGLGGNERLCQLNAPSPSVTDRHDLPDQPSGAELLWFPGVTADPCRTWRTTLDASAAQTLAADLRSSPERPAGAVNCPSDDGSFVQVWFATADGSLSYRVALSGCRLGAPEQSKMRDFGEWPAGMPVNT